MEGTCQFSFGERFGAAAWSFDSVSLVVTPEGAGPLVFAVKEMGGISGDDYGVKVIVPGAPAELVLSRLGHDGPTLNESLRREWLGARAQVLRLGGSGEGWPVSGQVAGLARMAQLSDGTPAPFRALLFEDVLVVAREGRDLEPVFLALVEKLSFDEGRYQVEIDEWPGCHIVFSKLGKQTDEFLRRIGANRALLAQESAATLAAAVPDLSAGGRGDLAGTWVPGRLMDLRTMDAACPGFEVAFRGVWLSGLLRHHEGARLLERASPANTWLGCSRETASFSAVTATGVDDSGAERGAAERPLWMLSGRNGVWFLEALSMEDCATYCFRGGDEVPALVSSLLCAPQFSKEALYSPLEDLTGETADLAIPARSLGFLVDLRARFQDRVIHQSPEGWRKGVEQLEARRE